MAQITLNIPDAVIARVLDGLCTRFGYSGVGTKAAFVKDIIAKLVIAELREHESSTAGQTASIAAIASVDRDILIT